MAINLTGQLTTGDANNIGNNSNYIRVEYMKQKMISSQIGGSDVEEEVVVVRIGVWKSKASFNNGKQPIQGFGARILNEIKERYILDAAILATAPIANFNALQGTTLHNKHLAWVTSKVLEQIILDNPTFSGTIVDIN